MRKALTLTTEVDHVQSVEFELCDGEHVRTAAALPSDIPLAHTARCPAKQCEKERCSALGSSKAGSSNGSRFCSRQNQDFIPGILMRISS